MKNNKNSKSLQLNKKAISDLNRKEINGGRAASNFTANLYQCLSIKTNCVGCNRTR
ncbi:hypothetical protein [Kordia sp.]|uniref:hypothetical protein n=1 Tax=Kordia sp. TaxID=1965332 RepID=UPI0025BF1309|nr:hypothetical protein [Kordia sp.]MCH2195484.1 hypothetical protein [Kordia sp.]